jgi:hypothetical protein
VVNNNTRSILKLFSFRAIRHRQARNTEDKNIICLQKLSQTALANVRRDPMRDDCGQTPNSSGYSAIEAQIECRHYNAKPPVGSYSQSGLPQNHR